jgi:SAM-dependent methyltransferase
VRDPEFVSTTSYRLYRELAHWWPLLSPPSEYVEEAASLLPLLEPAPHQTLLELGSGGGSLAFHLKSHFTLTLTDLSPAMLDVSRAINPECEHIPGNMRTLDLGRTFDRILIHEAIMYATDEASVRDALATAHRHCRPGGRIVVLPDYVRETFEPLTDHGGHDGPDGRALRYLEWTSDPDPADSTGEMLFTLVLREPNGEVHTEIERHTFGIFPRADWLRWFAELGLITRIHPDPWDREIFVADRLAA